MSPRQEHRTLLALLAAAALAVGWILLPFYGPILWSVVIALMFVPVHRWLLRRLGGWHRLAALLTLLIVLVVVIVPFSLITASLAGEAAGVYHRIQAGELNPVLYLRESFDALPPWAHALLARFGVPDFDVLQRRLTATLLQGSQFVATQAFSIGQNTIEFIASLFITLYLTFFLVRDGEAVVHTLRRAVPLTPAHTQALVDKFNTVVRATVKGNLLVAAVQGLLGGLAFWWLGITAALMWAVLMTFFSLLPAVGPVLVWLPVSIYLLAVGDTASGLGLLAWGTLVIGLVDNLLRPMLVGKDTRLPDYVVLMSTLGGMAVFGLNGFILGPALAAMLMAVWQLATEAPPAAPSVRQRTDPPATGA
ncbi:MAG: AI-2E family transporter [Burkholderiales bacterium]|nr:AI-2E family transporter [Burkholderiales bacterium]